MKLIKLNDRFIIPIENVVFKKDDVLTHIKETDVYSFVSYKSNTLITTYNTEIGICESWIANNMFQFKEQIFASTKYNESEQIITLSDIENCFINSYIEKGFIFSKAKLKANMLMSYNNSSFTKDELFVFYSQGFIADKSIDLKRSFNAFYETRFCTEWDIKIDYNPLLNNSLKITKIIV